MLLSSCASHDRRPQLRSLPLPYLAASMTCAQVLDTQFVPQVIALLTAAAKRNDGTSLLEAPITVDASSCTVSPTPGAYGCN